MLSKNMAYILYSQGSLLTVISWWSRAAIPVLLTRFKMVSLWRPTRISKNLEMLYLEAPLYYRFSYLNT